MEASFERWGGPCPESPVVLSVPHAGRAYPPAIATLARMGPERLRVLEDRHVDAVAARAIGRCIALVQIVPRAWIDLNRSEEERDPAVDSGARPADPHTARLRSGLGLVPRRAGLAGEVWRARLSDAEVQDRIARAHRPYHAALGRLLADTRDRFGIAVLLDLHSMPTLGKGQARVVIGDRFGQAAGARYAARAEAAALDGLRRMGMGIGTGSVALNAPYAGGHVLDRHGRPAGRVHAIQLELDRTLYLDDALDRPGPGLAATARLVADLIAALEDEALADGNRSPLPLAAE